MVVEFCSCWNERRFDGGESLIVCSDAGRLRSFGVELITFRVSVNVVLTTDRGGEAGFVLKRLQISPLNLSIS